MKIKVDKITGEVREDDNPFITTYNLESGLRIWNASLAKLKSGTNTILNISCLGDSITEGQGTTEYINQGYVGLLRNKLKSLYGDVGTGVISNFYPSNGAYFTYSGSWTLTNNTGYGITQNIKYSNSVGASSSLSFNGTGIRIITVKGGICGTMNVSIDGGANTPYNMNNASLINPYTFDITGLSAGNHTITITVSTGGYIYLIGAIPLKGITGVRVHNCARAGTLVVQSSAFVECMKAEIDIYTPVLTTIAFGANDYTTNTPIETFKTNVQTLITRAKTFGDVLLIANGLRTEVAINPQVKYAAALMALAKINNCAFIDTNTRWNNNYTYANTTLGVMADGVHPNAAGHQDIAEAICEVLLNDNTPTKLWGNFALSADQTTNLGDNSILALDVSSGNIPLVSNKAQLKGGKRYLLNLSALGTFSAATGFLQLRLQDYTNNANAFPIAGTISKSLLNVPPTFAGNNNGSGSNLTFIYAPPADMQLGVLIEAAPNATNIKCAYTMLSIMEL